MNVLLLQGPLGPFFADLADQMAAVGACVHRVCFNKGDWHYAKADHVVTYTGLPDEWADWVSHYMQNNCIDAVLCYGDSRFYHRAAKQICAQQNIRFFACEEGYVRPSYVTFEEGGNNANSHFPKAFLNGALSERQPSEPVSIPRIFQYQFWFATMYYLVKDWKLYGYSRYRHHRTGNWANEMMAWLRAGFRKQLVTRFAEADLTERLVRRHSKALFLVPLQVAVDTQMIYHSRFDSVTDFIREVIESFAADAPPAAHLVIKHHPMDRGFHHYGTVIRKFCRQYDCPDRVTYAFDIDLAQILAVAAGCVTVNSTVATQAVEAAVPTITLGNSMLADSGLTALVSLGDFWQNPPPVDRDKVMAFKKMLIAHTQIAGSFYCERSFAAREIAFRVCGKNENNN